MRSAFCVTGFQIATLDTSIGISLVTMPPGWFFIGFGFVCFFTVLMPFTITCSASTMRDDVAALALVAAGDDDDVVALLDLAHRCRSPAAYSTSGASDTIFMNRSVRSSRVTGPKMRVPIGSSLGLSSTAALVSKRISAPSARRTPWRVRTTTAL